SAGVERRMARGLNHLSGGATAIGVKYPRARRDANSHRQRVPRTSRVEAGGVGDSSAKTVRNSWSTAQLEASQAGSNSLKRTIVSGASDRACRQLVSSRLSTTASDHSSR